MFADRDAFSNPCEGQAAGFASCWKMTRALKSEECQTEQQVRLQTKTSFGLNLKVNFSPKVVRRNNRFEFKLGLNLIVHFQNNKPKPDEIDFYLD